MARARHGHFFRHLHKTAVGVFKPPPPAGRGSILLICVLYSSETQHVCIRWVSEDLHWIFDNQRGWVSVLKGCQRIPKTLILHPWVNPLAASLSTTKSWTRTFLFIFTGWTGTYVQHKHIHWKSSLCASTDRSTQRSIQNGVHRARWRPSIPAQ